jgi:hypothetical protein
MNLDQLFEDLESEFEAALEAKTPANIPGVERIITTVSGNRLSIDRPVFGANYVCGLVSGHAIWRFQPHRTLSVAKVTFQSDSINRVESQDAVEFLESSLLQRFVRYSLAGDGQQIRRGRVMHILQGLILFESTKEVVAVAVDRLAWLEVHAADN